jgi:hypothetical protein
LRCNGVHLRRTALSHAHASRLLRQHGVSNPITERDRCIAANGRSVPLSVVNCCSKMRLYDRQQGITRVPVVVKQPVMITSGKRRGERRLASPYGR